MLNDGACLGFLAEFYAAVSPSEEAIPERYGPR